MSKYRFHLQKYSLGSKIACPSCERPRCFVKYVDEEGVVSFSNEVGKCDHEISCGYHYTPRDFFRDNPNANIKEERSSDYVQPVKSTHEKEIIVKCTPNIGRISICLDGMSSVLYRAHVV